MTTLHAEVQDRLARELSALLDGFAPLLRAAHVPFADPWDVVPGLAEHLETVAGLRIIDELTRARLPDREALERAAKRLGIKPEALRKRIERLNARTKLSETAGYDEVDSTRIAS